MSYSWSQTFKNFRCWFSDKETQVRWRMIVGLFIFLIFTVAMSVTLWHTTKRKKLYVGLFIPSMLVLWFFLSAYTYKKEASAPCSA